ncbi:NUDIX domain-containing protein [Zavarzinia compransoris]|uniref:NUDIX domain-containing protein n=1 Tax=Zavarzinia compransoris TaxID=1264899 RepID=UPI0010F25A73|nr:NUDIX domain-containing protein [Zavarzinia compransoris]TDP46094.1 ADP-ribose pyrophosphatase [Zavarzinia compransoris]
MDKKVEILSREIVHQGFYPKTVIRLKHRRFDGGMSEEISRDILEQGGAAVVLPYDPVSGRVLLIEQFRPAPLMMGDDPWMLEAVAGRTEDGEDPAATAGREMVEEAGIEASALVRAGIGYPSPGCLKEVATVYVGRCDLGRYQPGTHGLADEHEDIRTLVVTVDEALAMAAAGTLRSLPALVALYWLALNRASLWREPA